MNLYPVPSNKPLTYSRAQLEDIAAKVPHPPEALRELSLPQLKSFLAMRHGECFGQGLEAIEAARGLNEDQQVALLRALDIHGHSSLFREPFSLRAFRQVILPSFRENERVAVASIGCSRGQDLLSFLLTSWDKRDRFTLEGFDLNPEHIEAARELRWFIDNWYQPVSEIPGALSQGYQTWARVAPRVWRSAFTIEPGTKNGRVSINPSQEVQNRLTFDIHDILLAPLPTPRDVVVLQNVLCHYTPLGRHEIMENIKKSLTPGGVFIGDAAHSIGDAAKDRIEFSKWYQNLEAYGFKRIRLPIWTAWAKTTFDETYSLFAYRAV